MQDLEQSVFLCALVWHVHLLLSAACLPCLGSAGSEGVSWEEICGVIQPGPLQFEYYTKAARQMGIQSQLPMVKLPELHTKLDLNMYVCRERTTGTEYHWQSHGDAHRRH